MAVALAPLCGMFTSSARAANTQYNVKNGSTDLTATATYTTGGTSGTGVGGTAATNPPSVASDVTFNSGVTYSPAAFTLGTSQTFGSLNDLSATAITISNTGGTAASTLTLGGSGDLGDGVVGSNAADLLFVGTAANLTLTGGTGVTALNLALGQSGNFDVAGTATISSAISGAFNLTRTGVGLLTLSGGINNVGTVTNSGTATTVYPSAENTGLPAGSTAINGTVGTSVTGIVQNGTSDLALVNLGTTYNKGVTIQNGVVLFSGLSTSLGAATDTITLGNSSTTSNATMDFAAKIGGSSGVQQSFANQISVGPKTGEGVNVISATDYALTLTGAIALTGGDLTFAPSNTTASSIASTGGITGTGNVFISDVASNSGNIVTLSGSPINNVGALTFNNATINGIATGTGNTGTNVVSANIGSNVTQVTQNSSTDQLTLSGTNTNSGADTAVAGILEFTQEVSLFDQTTPGTLNATTSNLIVQAGATAAFEVGNTGGFAAADIAALNALGTSTGGFESGSYLGIDTSGANFTYAAAVTNSGSNVLGLNKLGTNTLTLTGTNTYTGPTQITANTLQIGTAGSLGSGVYAGSILDKGTLEYSSSTNQILSGSIGGGSGGLTKDTSTSTLTLSGVNTFTGATSVTAGVLDLANSLALQNSTLTLSGTGTVTFDAAVASNAFTVGGLGGNPNIALQNNAATPAPITLTIGNPINNASTTTSGVFSGNGNLTFAGFNNTATLTGASTYTGTTTVTGSTLNLGGAGANGSIISASGSSAGPLALGGYASGGILAYTRTGTVAQSFNGTTISAGESSITTSTASQTLNLGTITATGGATVDINPNTTSSITTTSGNTNGILGGFATYGGKTTFAVAPATPGGAITGLTASSYTETGTALNAPANYTAQNIDVNASATPTGAINPNSIRFNTNTAYTLTLQGLNTIQSGGILVTPTANSATQTITGGTLVGSVGGQLAITNPNTGATVNINSLVVDNGTAPTSVAASGNSGGGYIGLTNINNSFSGGLYFNGGRLNYTSGGTPFGTGNVTFGNQVYTNAGGGGINLAGNNITSGLLADAQGTNSSNGDISSGGGTAVWNLIGTGSASFAGIIGNYAGGRTVNFVLDSGTEVIANTELGSIYLAANGGTFQVGNGYVGAYSNSANNVALNVGGGTFVEYGNFAGTTSQPFNSGLVVNPGASTVTAVNNSNAGTLVSFDAAGARAVGGTVNFVLPGGVQNTINGFTTVNANTNGILGGYATVGGTDWATNSTNAAGGNIVAYTGYTADTFSTGTNTDVTTSDAFAAGSTNSIRFNTAAPIVVTQSGTGIVSSGGILVTPNQGANPVSITGGTLEGASGADLVVIQNDTTAGGGLTISSIIANNSTGATGLTKSGPGLLTLTNTNTYTGGTFLNGGVLNTATAGINGSSTTSGITFNGGTLQAATGGITTGKAVVIGATGGTVDTNGNAVTLSGVVSGTPSAGAGALGGFNSTGAFAFTKVGAGTLTLSNIANTFGGGLVINNGTVQDASVSGTGTFGTGYVTFGTSNTPTLSLGSHNVTVAGLIGAGTNGSVTGSVAGTPVITLDGVSTQTFGGVISNGSATSVGLTLNLNNPTESQILTNVNTYTGPTTITSGTLQVGNNGATDGSINGSSGITDNAALSFNLITSATTNVYGNSISGTGSLLKLGTGTLTLAGSNAYTGTTTISAGTLQLGSGGTTGSLSTSSAIVNNGTLAFNRSNAVVQGTDFSAAALTGMGSLIQKGSSILTLNAANTYSGPTTITAGTLAAGSSTGLSANSAFNVTGGTLDASAFNTSIASLNVGPTGSLNLGFGNVLNVSGTAAFSGTLNLSGTASAPEVLINYGSETGMFSTFTGVPAADQLSYNSSSLVLSVATVTSAPAPIFYTDASGDNMWNTTSLNFNNSNTGMTVAYNDKSNGTTGDNVTFNDASNGNYNVSLPAVVNPTSLTVSNSAGNYVFSGAGGINGSTGLVKTGTGSLTLNISNTYTGPTNVSGGSLVLGVAGALPAGTNLNIASGASVIANNLGAATGLRVGSLSVAGKLDLNNNALVVQNSTLTAVSNAVVSAYANGMWNGSSGITSSTAANDTSHLTTLGVILNSVNGTGTGSTLVSSLDGAATTSPSDVLVKFTYYGDANLDGKVDGTDYSRIDNGYLSHLTGWYNGDFNYDGVVDGSDYTLIDNAFNSQGAVIAAVVATPTAQIAGSSATSAVPEPTTLGLLGLGAMGLLGRRTRRRR